MSIQFEIIAKDGKARTGIIHTSRGDIHTPTVTTNFTPALIRSGLRPADIKPLGAELVLVNTFHLYRENIKDVHQYLNWNGPIVADSGGFQMVSLAKHSVVHSRGVDFHWDGEVFEMTPEKVVQWQKDAGVDIIFPLDRTVHTLNKNPFNFWQSVLGTESWFRRSRNICPEKTYYILQGGLNYLARRLSLAYVNKWLSKSPGVAIGGLAWGEARPDMYKMVEFCTDRLPINKPRHLLGVGTTIDLLECIERGIDTFDCVASTREARHKRLWTFAGVFELKWEKHKNDLSVIETGCDCSACLEGITKAELIKGFQNPSTKQLMQQKCMMHNIRFLMRLMEQSREAIKQGNFSKFKANFLSHYNSKR
jgi:queuine tRNA-ribosyltransferase